MASADGQGFDPAVGRGDALVEVDEEFGDQFARFLQIGAAEFEVAFQVGPEVVVEPAGTVAAERIFVHDCQMLEPECLDSLAEGETGLARHAGAGGGHGA